ncbi:MAG: hypothetical protein CFE36_04165 [Sphingomonadaceae bacterium PASS1]|nr:MAG: hypothetical protein CFE36_04165 [Sphingomonadaceae bacterium PASS1]
MAPSPMLFGLKRRLKLGGGIDQVGAYGVFTTIYDEIVEAADLKHVLPKLSLWNERQFAAAVEQFDKSFLAERIEIAVSGTTLLRYLESHLTAEERAQTVVSFLIDHSGSMKGMRMLSALLAVECAVDCLTQVQMATEVLGFTTASWKGGKSRNAWRWAGRPANPGRLCDLRHIVYSSANQARLPWHLRMALRPDILHENIDGEALAWAAARLDKKVWKRRVICMISDGAPIDDSTLLANTDRNLLPRHLLDTQRRLAEDDFDLATLLIGGENVPEPLLFERAAEPLGAALKLIQLLRQVFGDVS